MEKHTVVAVDVAKAVFELAVPEEPGRIKLHRSLSRGELEVFFAQSAAATVVMEACGYRNSDLRPVLVKSVPQQVLGSIHRFRAGWIGARTAQVNTLRGLLRELGFVIPEGIEKVLAQVRLLAADGESGLPDSLRGTIAEACDVIESLGEKIRQAERQLEALAEQTPVVERLRTVPGIGLTSWEPVHPRRPRLAFEEACSLF